MNDTLIKNSSQHTSMTDDTKRADAYVEYPRRWTILQTTEIMPDHTVKSATHFYTFSDYEEYLEWYKFHKKMMGEMDDTFKAHILPGTCDSWYRRAMEETNTT